MSQSLLDRVINAVLYEGYLLYPYRPSVKNRQRWTFGGLYPPAYVEAQRGSDSSTAQTECLLCGGEQSVLRIQVRFLRLIDRRVGMLEKPLAQWPDGKPPPLEFVESLQVGPRLLQSWQEASEEEVLISDKRLDELAHQPIRRSFTFAEEQRVEPVKDDEGRFVAALVRKKQAVAGVVDVAAIPVEQGLCRIRVQITNQTPWDSPEQASRDEALLRSLVSAHVILRTGPGEFVSLLDPPEAWRDQAGACRNVGLWPVLIGDPGDRQTMLASPIILYDYPEVAPESPGDLFDATEIDEILTLRILTLTEDEKRALSAVDERARALLQRTQNLGSEALMGLHGTMRTWRSPVGQAFQPNGADARQAGKPDLQESEKENIMPDWNPFDSGRPTLERISAGDTVLRPGDRVRLWPLGRADILDLALEGKTATITAIEQDFEDRVYLAVTVDDDPGKDLGDLRQPGHRFFFGVEEVEPIGQAEGAQS
jgi:hypothetical protein